MIGARKRFVKTLEEAGSFLTLTDLATLCSVLCSRTDRQAADNFKPMRLTL